MLKYIGFILMLALAYIIAREYEKNQRKRLLEISEFKRLFEHIKMKISCFLSPKSDWLSDFKSSESVISEFILCAMRIPSLHESFAAVSDKLSLGEERAIIEKLFLSLGKAYKNDEIALLEGTIEALSEEKRRLDTEIQKNIKTVRVLVAAVTLGLIIFLI